MVLNQFDKCLSPPEVSASVDVTPETAGRIAHNYISEGADRSLYDNPRPGNDKLLTGKEENEIIALACTDPPDAAHRWSVRLLTQVINDRKIADSVGRETVRMLLKTHGLKPWRKKSGVYRN